MFMYIYIFAMISAPCCLYWKSLNITNASFDDRLWAQYMNITAVNRIVMPIEQKYHRVMNIPLLNVYYDIETVLYFLQFWNT